MGGLAAGPWFTLALPIVFVLILLVLRAVWRHGEAD